MHMARTIFHSRARAHARTRSHPASRRSGRAPVWMLFVCFARPFLLLLLLFLHRPLMHLRISLNRKQWKTTGENTTKIHALLGPHVALVAGAAACGQRGFLANWFSKRKTWVFLPNGMKTVIRTRWSAKLRSSMCGIGQMCVFGPKNNNAQANRPNASVWNLLSVHTQHVCVAMPIWGGHANPMRQCQSYSHTKCSLKPTNYCHAYAMPSPLFSQLCILSRYARILALACKPSKPTAHSSQFPFLRTWRVPAILQNNQPERDYYDRLPSGN